MNTRIIGIDLAVTGAHKAAILDQESNHFIGPLLTAYTDPADLERILRVAREGASTHTRIVVVLEATGMVWLPVATYFANQGAEVYRVTGEQTADQRRVYQRHAKSDRIDARVLPRLYLNAEKIKPVPLVSGAQWALQRACREVARLTGEITARRNRIIAWERLAWLSLDQVPFPDTQAKEWMRAHWFDPWKVAEAGAGQLRQAWQKTYPQATQTSWIEALARQAQRAVACYGQRDCIGCAQLQQSVLREQARIQAAEQQKHTLRLQVLRPLYRQLHPQRYLETIYGIGEDSAAVYIAFIGDILRFPSLNEFRGWSGMIPYSRQSGEAESKGLRLTQQGPDLIKATAYVDAQIARLWDPQIAAVYYDQLVHKGKHPLQAGCACATELLNRVYAVLREERPYQLRDVDGTPLDSKRARAICQERYTVPEAIRAQRCRRNRIAQRERRLERRAYNGEAKDRPT